MKVTLVLVTLGVFFALCEAKLCKDSTDCEEEECCLQLSNLIHKCSPRKQEGERCLVHQPKNLLIKELYKVKCPCVEGLKCVGEDNLAGKVLGKCEEEEENIVKKVKTAAPSE